jgi:2-dehydro-3-deoxygluconokinase
MQKIIAFGEILGRLSPPKNLRFSQATSFDIVYGGGEFNVLASLSNFGLATDFVTAIPENAIGDVAMQTIRSFGVGSQNILRQGERLGLYFLENGISSRSSNVVYDRANSAISQVKKGMFDWEKIFENATWFHWSGITTAISQDAADACLEAVEIAHKMGLTISTDLNYRSKLWKYGKEPKDIMPQLLQYSNIILGDVDTALFMLGKNKVNPDYSNEVEVKKQFEALTHLLPNLETIAMTFRHSVHASHQVIGGLLFNKNVLYRSKNKDVTPVLDRVGTGDAFMGGLVFGLIEFEDNLQKAIDFATAACLLKHTIFGDTNRVSKTEVEDFMNSDGAAKVNR